MILLHIVNIIIIIIITFYVMNYKRKSRNIDVIKSKPIHTAKLTGFYYQSVSSGIGNKLMAVANLLILSKIKNRNPHCIIVVIYISYRMEQFQ